MTTGKRTAERVLAFVNRASKRQRDRRYRAAKASGLARVVAEGDSWFHYPFIQRDIVDYLSERLAVRCLGEGGQSLADILRDFEIGDAVTSEQAKLVLISGGGNDLLVDQRLCRWIRDFNPQLDACEYPNESFCEAIEGLREAFENLVGKIMATTTEVPILLHGYDDMIPRRGGQFLYHPFRHKGITDRDLQIAIFACMNERFNAMLQHVARKHPENVVYADLRGTLAAHEWVDELHPTNEGYRRLTNRIVERLKEADIVRIEPLPRAGFPGGVLHFLRDVGALALGRLLKPDLVCRPAPISDATEYPVPAASYAAATGGTGAAR